MKRIVRALGTKGGNPWSEATLQLDQRTLRREKSGNANEFWLLVKNKVPGYHRQFFNFPTLFKTTKWFASNTELSTSFRIECKKILVFLIEPQKLVTETHCQKTHHFVGILHCFSTFWKFYFFCSIFQSYFFGNFSTSVEFFFKFATNCSPKILKLLKLYSHQTGKWT